MHVYILLSRGGCISHTVLQNQTYPNLTEYSDILLIPVANTGHAEKEIQRK
jgi:hypothetical protein